MTMNIIKKNSNYIKFIYHDCNKIRNMHPGTDIDCSCTDHRYNSIHYNYLSDQNCYMDIRSHLYNHQIPDLYHSIRPESDILSPHHKRKNNVTMIPSHPKHILCKFLKFPERNSAKSTRKCKTTSLT